MLRLPGESSDSRENLVYTEVNDIDFISSNWYPHVLTRIIAYYRCRVIDNNFHNICRDYLIFALEIRERGFFMLRNANYSDHVDR